MCDTSYISIQHFITNAVIPHKKPSNGELTEKQNEENCRISKYKALIENFYERTKIYWQVLKRLTFVYNGIEEVFTVCVALTNILICANPLCQEPENLENEDGHVNENDHRLTNLMASPVSLADMPWTNVKRKIKENDDEDYEEKKKIKNIKNIKKKKLKKKQKKQKKQKMKKVYLKSVQKDKLLGRRT